MMAMFDTKDLAAMLKIGRDRAYDLMRSEGFPSIKIGKTYRVDEEALLQWIRDNRGRTWEI